MGLGLHGGGLAAARFFAEAGAKVTVTDLRSAEILASSLAELKTWEIHYTLGEHREEDFIQADLVIKNPAVPKNSPFLTLAKQVETDISIFLHHCRNPLLAVTGSKGKSTVVSALKEILASEYPQVKLGGNITVSPLSFLKELDGLSPKVPVVLELSSWQLADLEGKDLLKPKVAVFTNLLKDHQNFYSSLEDYYRDKTPIFWGQEKEDSTLLNYDDPWGRRAYVETPGNPFLFSSQGLPKLCSGAYLKGMEAVFKKGKDEEILFSGDLKIKGEHNRINLLIAAAAAYLFGIPQDKIQAKVSSFQGIEHRFEEVNVFRGVRFINDSAATIPEATARGIQSLKDGIILIAGGADKNLDFKELLPDLKRVKRIVLLSGSATDKLLPLLNREGIPFLGPLNSLPQAVKEAYFCALEGDTVLLSPGCASFGLFLNEFDRGRKFKQAVLDLEKEIPGGKK